MSKNAKVPISAAKEIAKKYGKDQVIIVTWEKETGGETVTTYGSTLNYCEQAALGGNFVKKALGWPNELTEAKPARQIKREQLITTLKKRIKKLETDIKIISNLPNL